MVQRLAPLSNAVRICCPEFNSCLGHAVLSLWYLFTGMAAFPWWGNAEAYGLYS